jgi:hypothetical protein
MSGAIPPFPNTPSWRGAQLKHRDNFTASRPALSPIHPPIRWVTDDLFLEERIRGVELTTHLHLVPRLKMRGAIPPLPRYVFMAWYLITFTYISHHSALKQSTIASFHIVPHSLFQF